MIHRFFVEAEDRRVFLIEEVWETLHDRLSSPEPIDFKCGEFRILDAANLRVLGTATQALDDDSVFHLKLTGEDGIVQARRS